MRNRSLPAAKNSAIYKQRGLTQVGWKNTKENEKNFGNGGSERDNVRHAIRVGHGRARQNGQSLPEIVGRIRY
jgi:hypothetical protein